MGKAEDSKAKLFALRESGYDGPIDQDGNAVEDKTGILEALRKR